MSRQPRHRRPTTTTTTAYYGHIALSVNGTLSYTLSDPVHGSVSATVKLSGAVTATQLCSPYGGVRYQCGMLPTDYGFTHQRSDASTSGLDYYGARYYDPVAGQFTSADTVDAGGLNRYAYVDGNPTTATDPSGHCVEDLCIGEGILTYLAIVTIVAIVAVEIHNLQTHPISVSGVFGNGGTWSDNAPASVSGPTATSGASNSEMAAAIRERVPFHGYRFPVSPPTPVPGNGPAGVAGGAGHILPSHPPSTYPTYPSSGTPVSGTPASVGVGGSAQAPTDPGGSGSVITQTLGGAIAVGATYTAATSIKYYEGQKIRVRPLTDKEVHDNGFHDEKSGRFGATDVIYVELDGNGNPTGRFFIGRRGGQNVIEFP